MFGGTILLLLSLTFWVLAVPLSNPVNTVSPLKRHDELSSKFLIPTLAQRGPTLDAVVTDIGETDVVEDEREVERGVRPGKNLGGSKRGVRPGQNVGGSKRGVRPGKNIGGSRRDSIVESNESEQKRGVRPGGNIGGHKRGVRPGQNLGGGKRDIQSSVAVSGK